MNIPINITRAHILKAIEKIDSEPELKTKRSSSTYDLIFEGKKYPPILVLSIANQLNNGKELLLSDFDNNIEKPFKILRENGFEIIKKEDAYNIEEQDFINQINNFTTNEWLVPFLNLLKSVIEKSKFKIDDELISFTVYSQRKRLSINIGNRIAVAIEHKKNKNFLILYIKEDDIPFCRKQKNYLKDDKYDFETLPAGSLLYFECTIETFLNKELIDAFHRGLEEFIPLAIKSPQAKRHNPFIYKAALDIVYRSQFLNKLIKPVQTTSMEKSIKDRFREFMYKTHKNKSTSNGYFKMMPEIEKWLIVNNVVNLNFNLWRDTELIEEINKKLNLEFKIKWKELNKKRHNWYSSPWTAWNKFILEQNNNNLILEEDSKFNHKDFHQNTKDAGLIFSPQLIKRFIASLCTKPFVICSGLSGSGKTKLAQAFAQWITADKLQYEIVPVGADWTNREPLLGYPNALDKMDYVIPENGVLDLLIRARNEYDIYLTNETKIPKPYFLILDEMNLSHVERYFADFLSTMESGDAIPLHKIVSVPGEEKSDIPQSLKLPKNLFIIGTVNIDETTYMFSPKVLDRANTIEFRLTEEDLASFIESDVKLDMDLLKAQGANMSDSFMAMALKETDKNLKPSEADLKQFFSELKKSGVEFGYRTASEIGRLMYMLKKLGESGDNLLDIAIMQKLLPKLHGSRNKLTKVLPILGGFCLTDNSKIKEDYLDKFVSNSLTEVELKADTNIKFKISFEKICRMYKNAVENGFASYAEA